jgi:nucleoside phosphorylase
MDGRGAGRAIAVAVLVIGVTTPSADAKPASNGACPGSRVLLLGSYPAEVSANLSRLALDPGQPTAVQGHDFYSGRLEGRRVIIAIAGPSPAVTYATTKLALSRFSCVSAVVFEGTAGGGGVTGLGDVSVPSRWTETDGQPFTNGQITENVNAGALAVASAIAAEATSQLGTTAAVNDGTCACSGLATSLKLAPILRSPKVIVGGSGVTDNGGASNRCSAAGGVLAGCNPCPPGKAASGGRAPATTQTGTTAGTTYVADDQQTTASMLAADQAGVPFIAFRGISDTTAAGSLWPVEFLVYQQLAADNAAVVARLWIGRWNGATGRSNRSSGRHRRRGPHRSRAAAGSVR